MSEKQKYIFWWGIATFNILMILGLYVNNGVYLINFIWWATG